MFTAIARLAWRTAVLFWLNVSQDSWRRLVVAADSPHVHAPGSNPDRLLFIGDGASTGFGVRTHELGFPGFLARDVSLLTGRATDADIVVTTTMTASGCLEAISKLQLSRFDVIVLTLGANEALAFANPRGWAEDMTRLLDYIALSAPAVTQTVVLSIPFFGPESRFPRFLCAPVNRYTLRLNEITTRLVAGRPNVTFVRFDPGEGTEPEGAKSYSKWAIHIAPALSLLLQPRESSSAKIEVVDEASRQGALDGLGLLDLPPDAQLDAITTSAQKLFGVPFAAVALIDNDRQAMASAIGMDQLDVPRADAFCDVTIRRPESLVLEDTRSDPRFAHYPMVQSDPGIRFYAGYPIESQDGHRIGTLCVMDVTPREFTKSDSALLRQLAQGVQRRLWALSAEGPSVPSPSH